MDIVAAVAKLDTQFKRGLLSADDYSFELEVLMRLKREELSTTYTVIHLSDAEMAGKTTEAVWSEVCGIMVCYSCTEGVGPVCTNCAVDEFLSELASNGKAMMVTQDEFGTTTVVAYKNQR